jgi:hypothetical protein
MTSRYGGGGERGTDTYLNLKRRHQGPETAAGASLPRSLSLRSPRYERTEFVPNPTTKRFSQKKKKKKLKAEVVNGKP